MTLSNKTKDFLKCYHCGEDCIDDTISIDDKVFCCTGCKTVYELLNKNKLSDYYTLQQSPGISLKDFEDKRFDYLDDPEIEKKLIDFKDDKIAAVTFYVPQMHCSSCIWLLENLYKINTAIPRSLVNFLKKELSIQFDHNRISLKEVVHLITSIGYEPEIRLDSVEEKGEDKYSPKKLYYRIGVAAFCFGNIMLLSFPEYLSIDVTETFYRSFFGYLNLLLSLPVFFYSASDYFKSAWAGLKKKIINIDFPISLGILVLFSRSVFEVVSHSGAGYFDSLSGLVFFLLIGKLLQEKTYDSLNFERSYKSYFPLAVHVKDKSGERSVPVSNLKIGDRIIIRKNEIIPADSILFEGNGSIDYSFVTGESRPVAKVLGELIYAGGRQTAGAIELEVVKEVSQSYLTQLWNNDAFGKKSESSFTAFSNTVSKYFTFIILLIAFAAGFYWLPVDIGTSLNVITAVLIVACPCALALSTPFTLGNTMRIFGRNKFYLKNINAVEKIAGIDTIVFDKTGTITETGKSAVKFVGEELNRFQQEMIRSVVRNSTHPLSREIFNYLDVPQILDVNGYEEHTGLGVKGTVLGNEIKLGSHSFVVNDNAGHDEAGEFSDTHAAADRTDARVYLSFNNKAPGYFEITNSYRPGISALISGLENKFELHLLSGDSEGEKKNLIRIFKNENNILFRQSPGDKLQYISDLQKKNKKVLMVGDGLNDAGALSKSDSGISVTENISSFTPASDAIIDASVLSRLPEFIRFAKSSVKLILVSFGISFFYNIAGLSFAVEGMLSPIVAAVLMPASSISVVVFATLSTNLLAKKRGLLSR